MTLIQSFINIFKFVWNVIYSSRKHQANNATKIILLFNTDTIRSIIGPKNYEELTTTTINDNDKNTISVKLNPRSFTENIIGQMDQNLLSFMTNILLSHPIQSLVILRREKPDIKKRIEKLSKTTKKSIPNEDIFTYSPSRAEREYLEERF